MMTQSIPQPKIRRPVLRYHGGKFRLGMVIISSYRSPLYERLFKDWKTAEWTSGQFCDVNINLQKRTETVWVNAAAEHALLGRLF